MLGIPEQSLPCQFSLGIVRHALCSSVDFMTWLPAVAAVVVLVIMVVVAAAATNVVVFLIDIVVVGVIVVSDAEAIWHFTRTCIWACLAESFM